MTQVLRHRTAAGGSNENIWDLDAADNAILVSIRVASGPLVHVAIAVKNVDHRSRAANEFAIWCVSTAGDSWRIEQGVFDAHLPPPHPLLPPVAPLLTHAPEKILRELMRIAAR